MKWRMTIREILDERACLYGRFLEPESGSKNTRTLDDIFIVEIAYPTRIVRMRFRTTWPLLPRPSLQKRHRNTTATKTQTNARVKKNTVKHSTTRDQSMFSIG